MKTLKLLFASILLALLPAVLSGETSAQNVLRNDPVIVRNTVAAPTQSVDALDLLPASDIVLDIQMRRIIAEAIPRSLARSPQQLAAFNSSLGELKTRTGIDLSTVDRIVLGTVAPPFANGSLSSGAPPKIEEGLLIVQGRFDAEQLAAATRLLFSAARQEYAGRVLYTFTPTAAHFKQFGLTGFEPAGAIPQNVEAAIAVIDAGTLVLGTSASVRRSLEVQTGAGNNPEQQSWAQRRPGSLLSLWINTEAIMRPGSKSSSATTNRGGRSKASGLQLGGMDNLGSSAQNSPQAASGGASDDPTKKALESITRLYLSVGLTGNTFDTLLGARTRTNEEAQNLKEMLTGLQQMFASNANSAPSDIFKNLQISTNENELHVSVRVTDAEVASFVNTLPSTNKRTSPPARSGARRPAGKRRAE